MVGTALCVGGSREWCPGVNADPSQGVFAFCREEAMRRREARNAAAALTPTSYPRFGTQTRPSESHVSTWVGGPPRSVHSPPTGHSEVVDPDVHQRRDPRGGGGVESDQHVVPVRKPPPVLLPIRLQPRIARPPAEAGALPAEAVFRPLRGTTKNKTTCRPPLPSFKKRELRALLPARSALSAVVTITQQSAEGVVASAIQSQAPPIKNGKPQSASITERDRIPNVIATYLTHAARLPKRRLGILPRLERRRGVWPTARPGRVGDGPVRVERRRPNVGAGTGRVEAGRKPR